MNPEFQQFITIIFFSKSVKESHSSTSFLVLPQPLHKYPSGLDLVVQTLIQGDEDKDSNIISDI
tara:strand:+ start:1997 stop:2188 length:192 start_codon:yes stop_codon:yes gene_type:complete